MERTQQMISNEELQTTGGFSRPDRIIQNLNIPQGSQVADFGCGSGYFTILVAQVVGDKGHVTALDVQQKALDVVSSKAEDAGLMNVTTVRCNLEKELSSGLADNSQDMVLLANILFQSRMKDAIVKEAMRVTKEGGQVVMIDWLPHVKFGPHEEGWKFSPEQGKELAKNAGLTFVREFPASINHWGLLFKK